MKELTITRDGGKVRVYGDETDTYAELLEVAEKVATDFETPGQTLEVKKLPQ